MNDTDATGPAEPAEPAADETHYSDRVLRDVQPISDELFQAFVGHVQELRTHPHPEGSTDWFCMNLAAFLGERMGPVLARVREAETARDDALRQFDRLCHDVREIASDARRRHRLLLRFRGRQPDDELGSARGRALERGAFYLSRTVDQLEGALPAPANEPQTPAPEPEPGTGRDA
ncbi:hypothetical protein [Actinomadura sp. K4S16]|uniref:hypothetical protein n=1 Tax=Actinomadura sp. K4S16 TaxID=1316147 RepID=UPI0011EE6620|nr:hypothetical protein [Actinomadura sp. K4S16]